MPTLEELAARLAAVERLLGENVAHHAGEHRATGRDPLNIRAAGATGIDHAALQNIPAHPSAAADYLVGTAQASLSAEIVAGTAPGGELGGTWANPTVDATHSGSAHHAEAHGIAAHTSHATWKALYTDGSGDEQELSLGADGTFFQANGVAAAPTFAALLAGDIPATTQTIVLTAGGGGPTLTAASGTVAQAETTTNDVNYWYIPFLKDVDTAAFWHGVLPNWDGGTLTYVVHWTAAAGSGDAVFGLKAYSARNDDVLDTAFGTEVTVTDTLTAVGDLMISPVSSAVTPAGTRQEGNHLFINFVHRGTNGSDTFSDTLRVLAVVITFTTATYAD